jgi:hypothetical protein
MTDGSPRRWLPVAATMALAVLLIAAILILPNSGKTTTTTGSTTATTASLQTTSAAPSATGSTTTASVTSIQTSLTALTTSDYNSSLGLRLALSIGQSAIRQNQGVLMNVSLVNTLGTQNNLTAFTTGVNASLGPCSNVPLGVGIFRGNYAVGNVSDVKPLDIFGPGPIDCGAEGLTPYFSFAPSSDNVTLVYPQALSGSSNLYSEKKANASMQFWGYWTDKPVVPSADGGLNEAFTSFSPGLYTIAGEDWWGQVTVLHFQVGVDENPLTCATIASNSSFTRYTNDSVSAGPLKLEAYFENPRANDTVVLALSNTGNSTLAVLTDDTGSFYFVYTPYQFSPDGSQVQRWQYYAPNGTLSYPAFFYPNQCVLISMTLSSPQFPLTLGFTDNQTQTFNFSPCYLFPKGCVAA